MVSIAGLQPKGERMSYRRTREFLAEHAEVVELSDDRGARVGVCPAWVGRVMPSTCTGDDGPDFGFVNRAFIEAGQTNPQFNNYGGEERMWLSPEGGPFSLWFEPGAAQTLDNWVTPPAMNEGRWEVTARDDRTCRMTTSMRLQNASATPFQFDVARDVRLLDADDFGSLFGASAAAILAGGNANIVGYETANRITNRGPALNKKSGLVSIWILGMMNAGEQTVVIVPYKPGDDAQRGPAVKSDYFGPIPPERLRVLPEAVLFAADGHYRAKIGTSQRRARNVLGSIDFEMGVLTLTHFTMPDDPTAHLYMNNMWEVPQAEPYVGDVTNSYNDGPSASGEQLGAFYEIESLCPALPLATDASLEHCHRTVHVQADREVLDRLAKEILGVDLDKVRTTMIPG